MPTTWNFDNSYARLPAQFHSSVLPSLVPHPQLTILNHPLALSLGLDPTDLAHLPALFTGNQLPPGSSPIAQAYAGHQFGHLARLGDGRAILLGELLTPTGARFDLQLKGPGPTPYSRNGDGRAALGPMLREYLLSESLHALRIPTTRSLAVASTGEIVHRDLPLPGAVLTRIASSHIRVGTFVYFAALHDLPALELLTSHSLLRHFPHRATSPNRPLALLEETLELQASLIAHWMRVGFVHGVMNTDNMAISGETLDYGPCAFLDSYDPHATFSSIDHHGRYAFDQQPPIASWNLARLAEALLPIIHPDPDTAVELATELLATFTPRYENHRLSNLRAKLGLFTVEPHDLTLANDFLDLLHQSSSDYTQSFRQLHPSTPHLPSPPTSTPHPSSTLASPSPTTPTPTPFTLWHHRWTDRLARQPQSLPEVTRLMRDHNPAIIPRNHAVEAALTAATHQDLAPFHRILTALAHPYADPRADPDTDPDSPTSPHPPELLTPPPPNSPPYRTFCGT